MKTTDNNHATPEPSYYNLEELEKLSNNDPEFIEQMLEQFIEGAEHCGEELQKNLEQKNWTGLKNIAHKNIVSYTVLGLDSLAQNLIYIEHHAFNNEAYEKISDVLKHFITKNNQVIAAINDRLNDKLKEHVYY